MFASLAAALFLISADPAAPVAPAPASAAPAAAGSAEAAARGFLDSFNALDDARFADWFDAEATMFFPAGPFPKERIEGKDEVVAAFHRFFAMARERGMTRLDIRPLDLRVQDLGPVAVISFELGGNGNIGRRTLVMRKAGEAWRIVHFHASSLEVKPAG